MSSYTAQLCCERCGKLLAEVNAYHEPRAGVLVPQDFMERKYRLPSMFCQECLNRVEDERDE